jgi:hypothetical protein
MSKVAIACKLPHGLDLEVTDADGRRVVLNGSNHDSARNTGGYGITEEVDEALFDQWAKDHPTFPALEQGLIFKGADAKKLADKARDQSELRSGFEPINADSHGVTTDADAMKAGEAAQKALAEKSAAARK